MSDMNRKRLLIAAGLVLALALLAAGAVSHRDTSEPDEAEPERLLAPHGDPPPPTVSPDMPPGRTQPASEAEGAG